MVQEVSIRVGAEGEFCVHVCACVCMCFSVKRESLSINFVTDHELGHDYAYQTFKRPQKQKYIYLHISYIRSGWFGYHLS